MHISFKGSWNLTLGSVHMVIRGLCRCERQFADVASRREQEGYGQWEKVMGDSIWKYPRVRSENLALPSALWPGRRHLHSLALRIEF